MRIHIRTMVIGLVLAIGATLAPMAMAQGNAGDVKIHDPGDNGEHRNEPHVGCTFYVEGFNMVASSGSITFRVWPPSGGKSVVHASGAAESWASDSTDAHGHHHFVSGPYSLPMMGNAQQGTHYKVTVTDAAGHVKAKVFWTKCERPPTVAPPPTGPTNPPTGPTCQELRDCQPPPCASASCVPTPPTTPTTPPTAKVPFFPTATSLVLGSAGAIGSIVLALRRRV